VVAPGGQVYLADLQTRNVIAAKLAGGRACSFVLMAPATKDPQPDLGRHTSGSGGTNAALTVYGRVPARQIVPARSYSDVLTVTMTF
jgi:Spore Coat Protein U domain